MKVLAYILQTSAQNLQQVLPAAFVGSQQIGQIQRQYQAVQRLSGAFLYQPVQHSCPQATVQHIRLLLLKQEAVCIKNDRLFSHMWDNIPAQFHSPHGLRGVNNVGWKTFAQQRRFATSGWTNNHIPRQLPQVATVVEMALQTQ